jgi:hypothetical protein
MTLPTSEPGPIVDLRPGMRVVDSAGEEVGTVEDVRPGDVPDDSEAPEDRGGLDGLLGAVRDAVTTGDGIPAADRERLRRSGYLRIEGAGFLTGSRYAALDDVASADGDVVRLAVPGSGLVG